MKKYILLVLLFTSLLITSTRCSKDDLRIIDDGDFTLEEFAPVAVNKTNKMQIYAHYMPWFETPSTSADSKWGQHWTMANKNPDIVDANGKREIASHYYPLIGPYASSDIDVIEYHLLLMKYSGIDGILIDWYGTSNKYDYSANKKNTEAIVSVLSKVGIKFAIVYEDQTLKEYLDDAEKIAQAKADLKYLESEFFSKDNYIKIDGNPLLLVFGPQSIKKASEWTDIFSVLKSKPTFVTLFAHSAGVANDASYKNAEGEYIWVDATSMDTKYAVKDDFSVFIGGAYPGFNDYYKSGGWGETVLAPIDYADGVAFDNLLNLAKDNNVDYLQLITWNDFGEGTMIEPTQEFGYMFLNKTQRFAGVSYDSSVLEYIYKYYSLKKTFANDQLAMKKLAQSFNYFVSLQDDKAKALMTEIETVK